MTLVDKILRIGEGPNTLFFAQDMPDVISIHFHITKYFVHP